MQEPSNQQILSTAHQLVQKLKELGSNPHWKFEKKLKHHDQCLVSYMRIAERLAIRSVVQDIQASPKELRQIIRRRENLFKFYPTLRDMRTLKEESESTKINLHTFPGNFFVDDRDFVIVNHEQLSEDENVYINVSGDIDYPEPIPKETVRASVIILGFIVEKKDEKTSRVTYLSDGDVKGKIPDFIKRSVMEEQGPIAGILSDLLAEEKAKSKQ